MFEKSDTILRDIQSKRARSTALLHEAVALKPVYIKELVREAQPLKGNWIVIPGDSENHYVHCRGVHAVPVVAWADLDVRNRPWNIHTDYVEVDFDQAGCIIDGHISYNVYASVCHMRIAPQDLRMAHIATGDELLCLDRICRSEPFCAG